MRIDDANPHFWRTHDGGKSWTEINTGLAPGAVANSIREDPGRRGSCTAQPSPRCGCRSTNGNHWQSLRLDMPAVSVRDITVKDDNTCWCSDLVAATHGRGFWILDDLTPLRQAAALAAAETAHASYLVKPVTAVRVRFGMNAPTPWPPEVPAGENPPPGAILDYYLASDAAGPVTLEILDTAGRVVRTYSSTDPGPAVHRRSILSRTTSSARRRQRADCSLPLYWPAPPMVISTRAGMHRVWWDMRYDPIGEGGRRARWRWWRRRAAPHVSLCQRPVGAARFLHRPPHGGRQALHTTDNPSSRSARDDACGGPGHARVAPARCTPVPARRMRPTPGRERSWLRLTRSRETRWRPSRQPSRRSPGCRRWDRWRPRRRTWRCGGRRTGGCRRRSRGRRSCWRRSERRWARRRGRGGAAVAPTLQSVSAAMLASAMAMQAAEAAPTAREVAACTTARTDSATVMARWTKLTTVDLAALNAKTEGGRTAGDRDPQGVVAGSTERCRSADWR